MSDRLSITASRSDLVRELALLQAVAARKTSVPIVGSVLLSADEGSLVMTSTDLDTALRCSADAKVEQGGSIALPARKLHQIVQALPEGEVAIKVLPDAWATIEGGATVFKIAGLRADEFPAVAD